MPSSKKRFTLGSAERLKSRKLIERIFKEGKSLASFPLRAFYLFVEEAEQPLQTGFSASSRHFKKATDRNRIKRLLREAYRLQKAPLEQALQIKNRHLILFFIYTGKELPGGMLIKDKTSGLIERLIHVLHETIPPAA